MAEHVLKTWPGPFSALAIGTKRYEIRKADRPFRIGDTLRLQEWDPFSRTHTGRELVGLVTYMTDGGEWGIPTGLCVMSLDNVHEPRIALAAALPSSTGEESKR